MKINRFRRGRWQWQFSDALPLAPDWFSLFENPRADVRARLIMSENNESWFEIKFPPQTQDRFWLRLKEYDHLLYLNFRLCPSPLQKAWNTMCQFSSGDGVSHPYAYGWLRRGLRIYREALVFDSLSHFQSLGSFIKNLFDRNTQTNPRSEKIAILNKLVDSFHRIYRNHITPEMDLCLDELLCKLEPVQLKIVFRNPELIKECKPEEDGLINFLVWIFLSTRQYLPKTYLMRFLRGFLSREGLTEQKIIQTIQDIFSRSETILYQRIKEVEKNFWQNKTRFFWFETKGAKVFIHRSIHQNQVLDLMPSLGLLSRRRERLRLKQIGSKELVECELTSVPKRKKNAHPVSSAFIFCIRLDLENLAHQLPLVGVESEAGNFIIYKPLSGFAMGLNEYLARVLADELSGRSWDKRFLLRLANLLFNLHRRGLVYQAPRGDEIWVEELPGGRMNFYLTHLERLYAVEDLSEESARENLSEIFSSLPLSAPDSLIILEQYMRLKMKFKNSRTSSYSV